MQTNAGSLRSQLVDQAIAEGFSDIAICDPEQVVDKSHQLKQFVDSGYQGQMGWMSERMNWRSNPKALWPNVKSIIMLAENYAPEYDPLEILRHKDKAAVSVYAQNKDYHDLVKKRLKRLGRWLIEQDKDAEIKVFVDTAPVMEKPLAQEAGLGWQGKHTNLVSRKFGNWVFLGSIFTTLEFKPDTKEIDHCGTCSKCLEICPTNAFPAPYQLDARRCISYLTIEHKGPVDLELRPLLGNRIYGCDDCLAVCPWNKFAKSASEIGYKTRNTLKDLSLAELAKLDDASFRILFSKSPIKRIGRNRFVRNVTYAIGNSKDSELIPIAKRLLSEDDDTIVDAAEWALQQLEKT